MKKVEILYGKNEEFRQRCHGINGVESSVANFKLGSFVFEIFGQPLPTELQNGYLHMVIEDRLLTLGGQTALDGIRYLKKQGYKTEPAFTKYFGINCTDPYEKLLEFYDLDDASLLKIINGV